MNNRRSNQGTNEAGLHVPSGGDGIEGKGEAMHAVHGGPVGLPSNDLPSHTVGPAFNAGSADNGMDKDHRVEQLNFVSEQLRVMSPAGRGSEAEKRYMETLLQLQYHQKQLQAMQFEPGTNHSHFAAGNMAGREVRRMR